MKSICAKDDISDFFGCCCDNKCLANDWYATEYIVEDVDQPFVYRVQICLKAPCGKEIIVFEDEIQDVDVEEIYTEMFNMAEEIEHLWKKGMRFITVIPDNPIINKKS